MFDLVALGELLIDFTPAGTSPAGKPLFEQNPGGAPANVLAAVVKLGKQGAFMGMVGNDQFGVFLRDTLRVNGIETRGLKSSNTVNTTLAFVHLAPDGDRSFSFYRKPGADMMISIDELDFELIREAKIFHFGSISLTDEPARGATYAAAKFAKENGSLISYDPNYRPLLWPDQAAAVAMMKSGLPYADIVKVSGEELELLTGTSDIAQGAALLFETGISVVLVTLGADGCYYKYAGGEGHISGYTVQAVDTTGAGDAFLGGVLYWLSGLTLAEIQSIRPDKFQQIIRFANAAGALTTTKKGAIPALPALEAVRQLSEPE